MDETAYAKINLALHVRGREPDGYHRLETLFAFAEDGDLLSVAPANDVGLTVTGEFADLLEGGGDNLVLQAAEALRARFGVRSGARLHLEKRLPVAAGIGGGSADAAAALRLLCRFWSLPAGAEDLMDIARALGADVPACLASRTVRGEGRGDSLQPAAGSVAGLPLLLVNPRRPLATASVFGKWDGVDRGPLDDGDPQAAAAAGRNDLETAACLLVPDVAEVLHTLRATSGTSLVRMSGSGATCFALYAEEIDRARAASRLSRDLPRWWLCETRLR